MTSIFRLLNPHFSPAATVENPMVVLVPTGAIEDREGFDRRVSETLELGRRKLIAQAEKDASAEAR
jgi:hypothetical protein